MQATVGSREMDWDGANRERVESSSLVVRGKGCGERRGT